MPPRLRVLLTLVSVLLASLATARSALSQICPQIIVGGSGAPLGNAGPSARFLKEPVVAPKTVCVYSVLVTPKNLVGPDLGPNTGSHTQIFTVKNTGTGGSIDTYTLTCSATGHVTCSSVSPASKQLANGASAPITVTYAVGAPGTGTFQLKAHGTQGPGTAADSGSVSVTIGVPIVALAGLRFDDQDLARCAVSCFQFGHAQSTVPYFSFGAPQAVALVYRQEHNVTQPFIHVDVQQPTGGTLPTKWWLQATLSGAQVTFANGETVLKFSGGASQVRLGGQLNRVTGRNTGVYPLNITVTAEFAGGVTTQTVIPSSLTIVEDMSSPIAQGWTLGGVQHLYLQSGSPLATDGFGSAVYFVSFTRPPGELSWVVPEYDGQGHVYAYTRRYPDSTKVWFDLNGFMTKSVDPFGNTTQIKYDANSRVDSIIDPMNRAIVLAYDANGLHTITDPGGRVTTVTVQASKLLTQITDPDTKFTSFGYDGNAKLTSVTDRRGKATSVYYNVSAQPDSIALPAVPIYSSGNLQPTTRFKPWQLAGVPYTPTNVTPFTPPLTSSVEGQVIEPGGVAVNHLKVDRWGQPLTIINAIGDVTTFTYDTAGQLVKRVLPYYGLAADTAARDTFGLGIYHRIAIAPGLNFHRAGYGQVDSIWGDSTVPVQRIYVGTNGRVDSVRVAGIVRQRLRYDARGRIDTVFDAKDTLAVRYHFDATTGNVDTVYSPGGVKTSYAYDTFGRPTTIKAPGLAAQTLYYSILNRTDSLKTSDGTSGRTVKYGYDELFVRAVTDPKGQVDSLFYNDVGWLTSEKDPAGASLLSAYSLDGELKQWTNRRGQAIAYTYDAVHRPTQKSGTNTDLVTWAYSAASLRKVTATSPVSTDTTYLNVLGSPDSVKTVIAGQTFTRRYGYRGTGQLLTDNISGGGITTWQARAYAYDQPTGQLSRITVGTNVTTFGRDANFDIAATTLPAAEIDSTTLGSLRTPLDSRTPGAPYASTTDRLLSLDPGYRLQQQFKNVTPASGRFFAYDSLGELTSGSDKHWTSALPGNCLNLVFGYNCQASGTGWTTDNSTPYTYDLAGNRNSQSGTYASANRITGFNGCAYGTDADGNVTSRTCTGAPNLTATFTWSAEGQLTSVANQGNTYNLKYDASGLLVRTDLGATPQSHYLWDAGNILAELNGTATSKVSEYSYYPGLDHLHALVQGSTAYLAHQDGLGNIIALTDVSKNVQRTYTYDDWGALTGGTDTHGFGGVDRARWKGALQTSMAGGDLYYMRNRWYEAQTGRFLSEDPLGLAGGLNVYLYAEDDPINASDPFGLTADDNEPPIIQAGGGCFWQRGFHDADNRLFWPEDANDPEDFPWEFSCSAPDGSENPAFGAATNSGSGGGGGGKHGHRAPSNGGFGRPTDLNGATSRLTACVGDQLGVRDLAAGGAVALGAPLIRKRFVTPGTSAATSVASSVLSEQLPQRLPFRVWAPTLVRPLARSNVVGRILGRWIPWLGWGLLAYDTYSVVGCATAQAHGAGGTF